MKTLLSTFFIVLLAMVAQSQCRPATAQENQVYEQMVKELQRQFTVKTPTGNWKVFSESHSMGALEVTSEWGGFVHLCTDRYDLIMELTNIATTRQTALDTLKPTTVTLPSLYVPRDSMYRENPATIVQATKNTYTVSVEMNLGNYRLQDKESARLVENAKNILVTGSSIAFEVSLKPDLQGAVGRQEIVILIGGWNTKAIERDGDRRYQPKFKKGGVLIENLAVTITAPFDISRQIVNQIDWKAINSLLTK